MHVFTDDFVCSFVLLNCPLLDVYIIVWLMFQEMIDEADRDGDGEINETEFLRIMKKTSLY